MTNGYFTGVELRRLLVGMMLIVCVIVGLIVAQAYSVGNIVPRGSAIGLMSSLPLRWQESMRGKTFDLDAESAPAFARLTAKQDVRLLDNFENLSDIKVLLLAQPRALSGAEHVLLDQWVRDGGRAIILADPALAWESIYPLGDKRRPLFTSLLSPLLNHWGLQLELNMDAEERDVVRTIAGLKIRTQTIGIWSRFKEGTGAAKCTLSDDNVRADCRIGKGRAIMLADADLLLHENWHGTGLRQMIAQDDFDNIVLVERLIDLLQGQAKTNES